MKILIDARLYGLENAGLGRYVINLIENLSRIDSQNKYVILLRKKYFNQLNLPKNWRKELADFRHYSFTEQFLLPLLIRKINPDLIHFPHFNAPLICPKPFVVTIHDMLMHQQNGLEATTLSLVEYRIKRLGYRLIFDNAVRRSLRIIVPSHSVENELISHYRLGNSKICVTYEGVTDLKVSKDDVIEKYALIKPYFIYTGNAYPHKNLKKVIEAIVQLNRENEKVNLVIVSSRNIFTKRLEEIIFRFGGKGTIKLLGYVPDEELSLLYKYSLAFVYPSLSEGFGLPGLEAIKAGALCVVSDIPVFREIYKNYVFFFDPKNVQSICSSLKRILKLSNFEKEQMINQGQEFVKIYSWDKMSRQTLKIYEGSTGL